jgi:hypothetical protein
MDWPTPTVAVLGFTVMEMMGATGSWTASPPQAAMAAAARRTGMSPLKLFTWQSPVERPNRAPTFEPDDNL